MATREFPALSRKAVDWVVATAGNAAEVSRIETLSGGTSSALYELDLFQGEEKQAYILRLFTDKEWLAMEPDLARHEAESLRYAEQLGMATPRLIGFDELGEHCGAPAVLMTKLEGAVVLEPKQEPLWIDGLAQNLAAIHQFKAEGFPFDYFSYNEPAMEKPLWSKRPEEWMRAFYIIAGPRPPAPACFIHRDYHPANVLWTGNQVSGIVDWVNSCRGPAGIDVGHCRVNLAQLHGVSAADDFLGAYYQHAGSAFSYDPYWDLLSLTDILEGTPSVYAGWPAFGVKGLSDELVQHRLDTYLLSLLDRFDEQ
ncbi:phosphotransferase family protein [Planococcus sp. YIM B11945]|uniref:phosphotransferase family protein n=1 Tax=Planococcus sp. YIM B11945 TaxID=3435410 RepID=UPI003D7E662B